MFKIHFIGNLFSSTLDSIYFRLDLQNNLWVVVNWTLLTYKQHIVESMRILLWAHFCPSCAYKNTDPAKGHQFSHHISLSFTRVRSCTFCCYWFVRSLEVTSIDMPDWNEACTIFANIVIFPLMFDRWWASRDERILKCGHCMVMFNCNDGLRRNCLFCTSNIFIHINESMVYLHISHCNMKGIILYANAMRRERRTEYIVYAVHIYCLINIHKHTKQEIVNCEDGFAMKCRLLWIHANCERPSAVAYVIDIACMC